MKSALFVKSILRMTFVLSVAACSGKPPIPVSAPEGKWVSLFNGKDLSDWTVKIAGHELNDNYQNTFRVENGLLKVSYEGYDQFGRQFGSLFYNQRFSHYWIRAEYRFVGSQAAGAPSWAYKDSGIQFHSQSPASMRKDQEFPVSVEFNLIGGRIMKRTTGDVCRNGINLKVDGVVLNDKCSSASNVTVRGDDWITVLAEVQGGSRIKQIVNGNLVVEYTDLTLDKEDPEVRAMLTAAANDDAKLKMGFVAPTEQVPAAHVDETLSAGFISLQSNSHPVEFRKIELLPLD